MSFIPNTVSLRTKAGTFEQCAAVAAEGTTYGNVLAKYDRITDDQVAYESCLAFLRENYDTEHYAHIDVEDIFIDNALVAFEASLS